MFYLHASNKTEHLLQHLASLIEVDDRRNIFAKEYILIQSQGMERMISQYMADYFKSWCNFEYLLPISFLQTIAKRLGLEIQTDSFDRNALCWRIEDKLHRIDDDVYHLLYHYLNGENVDLKRYQLARKIANVFDQYQLMRPRMLHNWQKGHLTTDSSAELWQMHLWNRLIAGDSSGLNRGELLQRVIAKLAEIDLAESLPSRISVFGLHIMPPLFLDYLKGMSKHCDVHLFLLSPCQHYWGDMKKRRHRHHQGSDGGKSEKIKPEITEEHHPLLTSLGEQGVAFQEMLLDNISFEKEITSYEPPSLTSKPSLLHHLQTDLLNGFLSKPGYDYTGDYSLKITSCHSELRELTVVKDHILDLLYSNSDLHLRDIIVMAPDIQEYAAFIPAVFVDIQHSISDRSLHQKNTYVSIFAEFLSLFSGRFGWDEVLSLLQKDLVYQQFDISSSEFDLLQNWIISSGIRWGLSGESRKASGIDFSENSWRAGLERLLMGVMIDSESSIEGIIAYTDIEGGQGKILGGVCEFIEVIERAASEFSRDLKLKDWSVLLLEYTEQLFGSTDERDLLELREVIRELRDFASFHDQKINLIVIRKWFENSSSESRSASGFLRGQLTFCSMLPMRSIPFKAVCLVGLNYGQFPKIDRATTFDLMSIKPQPGDRSLRADDRYQFLEALLSARENLYISYKGQSIQNNEDVPPSVVVSELLEVLEKNYKINDIVVRHPLHPFSSQYFSEQSAGLFSYSEENFKIATTLRNVKVDKFHWWTDQISADTEQISVADLLSFYRNPQLYFVKKCLGIDLHGEAVLPEESESFQVEGLDSYLINQRIINKCLSGEDLQNYHRKLCDEGRWPLGAPGELRYLERSHELKEFAEKISSQKIGEQVKDAEVDIRVGKYHLTGSLTNLYTEGVLIANYTDLKGRDLLTGFLHHLINRTIKATKINTQCILKDSSIGFDATSEMSPDLEQLLDHFADGCRAPSSFYVEPAFSYCKQKTSRNARVAPLQKAESAYMLRLEKGYEPAWALLNQGTSDVRLGEEFLQITERLLMPIWSLCHGK